MSRNKIQRYVPNRMFLETLIGCVEAFRCRTLDNFSNNDNHSNLSKRESTSRNPLNEQISSSKGGKKLKQTKLEEIRNRVCQETTKPEETTFREVKTQ